jgi:hypothetical protein
MMREKSVKKKLMHPLDAGNLESAISGKPLMPGDVWQAGDVFAASNKRWKPVPTGLLGKVVQSNFGMTAARPTKK